MKKGALCMKTLNSQKTACPWKTERLSRFMNRDNTVGYVFIAPFIIGFLFFTLYPLLHSLYLSFTSYSGLNEAKWIGSLNYIRMFTKDPRFLKSLGITFLYVGLYVPLRLMFALIVAMMFKRGSRATSVYRTIYYLPSVIGGSIAVAVVWRQLWGYGGIINKVLMAVGLMDTEMSFIATKGTALLSLIVLSVWQFGSPMLVFLAGLKDIPADFYEAAEVDGAGPWQKFWKITFPCLTPVIFFNLINQLIQGFMAFTETFVITRGGPNDSTMLYVMYLYEKSFTNFQMGYGSAMAWVLIVIVGILTLFIFKSQNKWVHYENKGGV